MDKEDKDKKNEDLILNELIRESRDKSGESFIRPSDEDITAYLQGTASEDQESTIKQALIRSSEFRQEILEMTRDLEKIEEKEIESPKTDKADSVTPDYSAFMKERVESSLINLKSETFWKKLVKLRIPQLYVPAIAAAAILLIFIIPLFDRPYNLNLVVKEIDKAKLIKLNLRESGPKLYEKDFTLSQDAALASFREIIEYENKEFVFTDIKRPDTSYEGVSAIKIELIDDNNETIAAYEFNLPSNYADVSEVIEVWVLTLPSRALYSTMTSKSNIDIRWTEDMEMIGCITIVYQSEAGFRTIIMQAIDIND